MQPVKHLSVRCNTPFRFVWAPFLLTSLSNPNSTKMLEKEVGHFGDGFV